MKRNRNKKLVLIGLVLGGFFLIPPLNGQDAHSDTVVHREDAIRVFIDCFYCDMNFVREEIPYVNYVRDVKEAQVYILETSETTGREAESIPMPLWDN